MPDKQGRDSRDPSTKRKFIADFLMVFFTFVIAGMAVAQYFIFRSQREVMRDQWKAMRDQYNVMDNQLHEMRSGAKDTHDLAVAAKAQADSTKAVADRARAQVEATNKLAQEASRSADISDDALRITQELANLERRPWIGFNFIDNTAESEGYFIVTLIGTIANTGKTPAVDMARRVFLTFRYHFDDKNIDVDSISKDYYSKPGLEFQSRGPIIIDNIIDESRYNREIFRLDEYGAAIRVVPPNSIREFKIIRGDKIKLTGRRNIDPYERKGVYIYIVGEIVYYDTSRANKYMTNFCIKRDFEDDSSIFTPCPFGNDMK